MGGGAGGGAGWEVTKPWFLVGGWGGRWQKTHGAAMTLTGNHTMAHATVVGYRDVQSAMEAILGPHHLIRNLLRLVLLFPVMTLDGQQ